MNVPKQEVGRLSYKELTLSRANKSVRIFNHVVENLSKVNNQIKNLYLKLVIYIELLQYMDLVNLV